MKQVVERANKLKSLGLDLEPRMTVLVEFSKQEHSDKNTNIKLKNKVIENTNGTKFLDIWLDNKLLYSRQVKEIRSKVDRANSIITYLNKNSKGIEVNAALMVYKSMVRSISE